MIYDVPIVVYERPAPGSVVGRTDSPSVLLNAYCGKLDVYNTTFWASLQAGSRADAMVELPLHYPQAVGGCSVDLDGKRYEVSRAQLGHDNIGLPVTRLTLQEVIGVCSASQTL